MPRPYSPPIHRLCFSKTHSLEYGFPSTHSANAVSIGLFLLAQVDTFWPSDSVVGFTEMASRLAVQTLIWIYIASITFGRLYCGMHGLLDVGAGSLLGVVIYQIWLYLWPQVETWTLYGGPWSKSFFWQDGLA